jgi:hypothetical protein
MNLTDPNSVSRRDFLTLGLGAASLVAGATSALAAGPLAPGTRPDGSGPVSLAYWKGSESLPRLDWETALKGLDPETLPQLVLASRLRNGDPMFEGTGVRLGLYGLFPEPDPDTLPGRASILLDIVYEPTVPIVHRAWNLRAGPPSSLSSPVTVFVPVDEEPHSVRLRGELRSPARSVLPRAGIRQAPKPAPGILPPPGPPVRSRAFSTRLTTGSEKGVPKLLRGFYLLGLPAKIDGQPPDWYGDPRDLGTPNYSIVLLSIDYGDVRK